ncbi:hypothetical protein [Paenibacillus sp. FSL K6-2862]|uniref:hypothetical protein n=1 Tax=Paenibacillus sp. FSL K6-2862 TaxID=2921484 RepID=UPI0030FC812B
MILILSLALINSKLKVVEKTLLLKCLSQLGLSKNTSYSFIFLNYKAQDFQSIEEKLIQGTFQNTIVIFIGPPWLYKMKQKRLNHITLINASEVIADPSIYKTNVAYILNGKQLKVIENANTYV